MSRIDNEKFYTAAIKKHGENSKGVHWNSVHSQVTRFKVLLSHIEDDDFSLVDAGCGFGDLYFYLQEKEVRFSSYKGLDLCASMVEIAKEKTDQEIMQSDICKDVLPEADYYICSGAMNILTRFDTYLFIRNCYEASRKGFVFNLLLGEDDSLVYNHFFPKDLEDLFEDLGAVVSISKGYLAHDFTAFLKKP
ncbi:MAG: methyltransferase type 11 [Arcobacter sp.]|nr:MAG: methyltransferase type 11 [Arcobacter sp.]